MKRSDLIAEFRLDVRDTKKPYLISDDKAGNYLDEAHTEAARRARMLIDSTTDNLAVVPFSAGDPTVTLDKRIISVRRMRIVGSGGRPLTKMTIREMDEQFPGWEDSTSSTSFIAIVDYGFDCLRLYPTPAAGGTLAMTVTREPLDPMTADDDEPEIPPRAHRSLIHWMRYRTFSDEDTELFDEKKAANALASFEIEFGSKSSAINERFEFDHYNDVGEM